VKDLASTFFAPERPAAGVALTLPEEAAHHARVKRLEVGERVRLVDGQGAIGEGRIVRLARQSLVVDVETEGEIEAPPPIHVLVPIADRDRMLMLAEKCAELGAASWRPVLFRRSRSVQGRGEGTTFRMKVRARMAAALEQSGGAWLPVIYPEATVDRALAALPPGGSRLLLDQGGAPVRPEMISAPSGIAVGPEGGIEEDEHTLFLAAGFAPVRVGGAVLRFETAAIAALSIARAALDYRPEE
jgi:16S rRNA (uracil1498-N3)-methyltransferase